MDPALDDTGSVRRAYRQLFELGRGGMARVYLAESLASGLRKPVVLKVLNPLLSADTEVRAAFRREAELSAQMNHPNVVQVMEVVETPESAVIVMEHLEGKALSALLKEAGKHLSLALHMHILTQVLAGLHHFHELRDLEGTPLHPVHRDVSPQNVMVLHDGPVKVLDFGIAKINAPSAQGTRTGIIKGKIRYMPPEQMLGSAGIDRRADIFAVGVMLWEAVARRRVWEGKTEVEQVRSLLGEGLPDLREAAPDVPQSVLEIVTRATAVEPDERFATATEMQNAIERVLAQPGWSVSGRELADFMLEHFGASRREERIRLQTALRESPSSGDVMHCSPLTPWATVLAIEPSAQKTRRQPLLSRAFGRSKMAWPVWAGVAIVVLGLGGAWTAGRSTRATQGVGSDSAALAPKTVTLEVDARPSGAEVFLDGVSVAKDHFVGSRPLTDKKLDLEVRAAGYLTEHRTLSLSKDTTLQIALAPDPALAVAAPAPIDANVIELDSAAPTAPRTRSNNPSRAATKPAALAGNRSAQCTPPYVFGPDGVKTFKPQCF